MTSLTIREPTLVGCSGIGFYGLSADDAGARYQGTGEPALHDAIEGE